MNIATTGTFRRTVTVVGVTLALLAIPATALAAFITGGPGNDVLYGTAGMDMLDGMAGNDIVYGFASNDDLRLGSGFDTGYGGGGDDVLRADTPDRQTDRIYCGPGNDYVEKRPEDWTAADCERVRVL